MIFRSILILAGWISICQATTNTFSTPTSQTWYTSPEKGWLWYKKTPSYLKKEKSGDNYKSENPKGTPLESKYPYSGQMEKIRKDFEEIQNRAILEPTVENVQRMQRAQNVIMDRSTTFEKVWMLSLLLSGDNYRESDQPSPMHRKIYLEQTDQQLDQKIHALAKTHGLFFIFKKDCRYCHEFAPIVRKLIDTYRFDIKAISPDGESLEQFPDAVRDNGTIAKINPEGIFPTLYLINPHTHQVIPLSRGLVNLSEIRENFKVIIQYLEGEYDAR